MFSGRFGLMGREGRVKVNCQRIGGERVGPGTSIRSGRGPASIAMAGFQRRQPNLDMSRQIHSKHGSEVSVVLGNGNGTFGVNTTTRWQKPVARGWFGDFQTRWNRKNDNRCGSIRQQTTGLLLGREKGRFRRHVQYANRTALSGDGRFQWEGRWIWFVSTEPSQMLLGMQRSSAAVRRVTAYSE